MVKLGEEQLNPWFSIFIQPRLTTQRIIESDPNYMVIPLAGILGFVNSLDKASTNGVGDNFHPGYIFCLAISYGVL